MTKCLQPHNFLNIEPILPIFVLEQSQGQVLSLTSVCVFTPPPKILLFRTNCSQINCHFTFVHRFNSKISLSLGLTATLNVFSEVYVSKHNRLAHQKVLVRSVSEIFKNPTSNILTHGSFYSGHTCHHQKHESVHS